MGVYRKTYLVFGVKCDYNKEFASDYLDYKDNDNLDGHSGMAIIDGMSGKYIVLGKILLSIDPDSYDEMFYNLNEIKTLSFYKEEDRFKKEFEIKFPKYKSMIENKKFDLLIFNHFFLIVYK